MNVLTGTVKQNADNAGEANRLVASTSAIAVKGGAAVGRWSRRTGRAMATPARPMMALA